MLFLSNRGAEFTAQAAKQVYKYLGSNERLTKYFHPHANGCVDRIMLSHVARWKQNNWDRYMLQVVYAHSSRISRATGLAPNKVHIGKYPRLPLAL